MPWVGLESVIVVFSDHIHLLFIAKSGKTNLPFMYLTPGNEQYLNLTPFVFVFRIYTDLTIQNSTIYNRLGCTSSTRQY